jgi:hypothetical protein
MGYLFRCFRTSLRSALGGLSRLAGRLVVAGERYVFPEARYMSHFETHARWCIVVADAAGPTRRVPERSRSNGVPIQYCRLGEPRGRCTICAKTWRVWPVSIYTSPVSELQDLVEKPVEREWLELKSWDSSFGLARSVRMSTASRVLHHDARWRRDLRDDG